MSLCRFCGCGDDEQGQTRCCRSLARQAWLVPRAAPAPAARRQTGKMVSRHPVDTRLCIDPRADQHFWLLADPAAWVIFQLGIGSH